MGKRFSTKPTKPVTPKEAVKSYVQSILRPGTLSLPREIGFREEWVWEEHPTINYPYHTRVTFYGTTRFQAGIAHYEGPYGKWAIDLAPSSGPVSAERMRAPCTRVRGSARCFQASDDWQETPEQRKQRIARLGDAIRIKTETSFEKVG